MVYSNLMSILKLGVKSVLEQRESQLYGPVLEEAISLSFQIFIHAFMKESLFVEAWYPSHQVHIFNSLSTGRYVCFLRASSFMLGETRSRNECMFAHHSNYFFKIFYKKNEIIWHFGISGCCGDMSSLNSRVGFSTIVVIQLECSCGFELQMVCTDKFKSEISQS